MIYETNSVSDINIKSEIKHEIIGSLNNDLKNSRSFSCMSGNNIDNLSMDFYAKNGTKCKLKIFISIEDVDESKMRKAWHSSPKEMNLFLEWAELYYKGDKTILRADDEGSWCFGFVKELPSGKGLHAKAKFGIIKSLYPELFKRLISWKTDSEQK